MYYPITSQYVLIRHVQVSDATARQSGDKIDRILRDLSENFGVSIHDFCGDRCIEGLTPDVLNRWYISFAQGRKMSTVNCYVCMLNGFLEWAQKSGYLESSRQLKGILKAGRIPSIKSLPKSQRPKDKYASHEQIQQLLNYEGRNNLRDRAIIMLILSSGLRIEELCSLTVGDIRNSPVGEVEVKRKGGEYETVYISPAFYDYLSPYLETRGPLEDEDPLFMTTHGNPISPKQVYKALSKKQKDLDMATGPHALRHTFISETEKIGGVGVARDLANHKSIRVTNRYDHTNEQQRKTTVGQLNWMDH